jgi:hypothetical protein
MLVAVALGGATTHVSGAQDATAAVHDAVRDLRGSDDFRVRVSAALVLGRTRPPGAREALERALLDANPAVRSAAATALGQLGVRYVVKLGAMRNGTGVRGEELRRVLQNAARARAHALREAAVVEGDVPVAMPVVTLDGNVTQLTEASVGGSVQVQARVEFAIRREQTLRGTISGAATTFGVAQALSDTSRRRLQDDAVDGAVQSALHGAEQGLIIASR